MVNLNIVSITTIKPPHRFTTVAAINSKCIKTSAKFRYACNYNCSYVRPNSLSAFKECLYRDTQILEFKCRYLK